MVPGSASVLRESYPNPCTFILHLEVSQFSSSLMSMKLLSLWYSLDQVDLWVSECVLLKPIVPPSLATLFSLWDNLHLFSQPVVGTFLPGTRDLSWGELCGARTPHFLGETTTAKLFLLVLKCHNMGVGPAHFMSLSLLPI